jgi:hypothetical protein
VAWLIRTCPGAARVSKRAVMMVPLNSLVSVFTLLQAKSRGLTARVPPLLG